MNRVSLALAMTLGTGYAAPEVSNIVAQQRASTHLVDISYDLDAPGLSSVLVKLEVSVDAG